MYQIDTFFIFYCVDMMAGSVSGKKTDSGPLCLWAV